MRRQTALNAPGAGNTYSLSVTGINHDTAPLRVRERLALSGDALVEALAAVREHASECVILSTCNRLEIYALSDPESGPYASLNAVFGEDLEELRPYIYRHEGLDAVRHAFTVASGIDSLVLGEVQILGQVQRAWQAAHKAGAVGPTISQLFHKAVALGKRVHSETPINRKPASVSYAAVVLARQIFGEMFRSRRVLVIGTGEVGEGVARCLHEYGLHATVVAHRQLSRAQTVARRYEAEVALWEDLPARLAAADIVITSTSAPHTILQRQQIEAAMPERENRPLYLIDLAVPRDVDPSAGEVPGVFLHNIDDLQQVVRTTLQERESALPGIRAMIDTETALFADWLRARSTAPAIQHLRSQAGEITESELKWAMSKLPDLTPRERHIVEVMATRITGKLLHGSIQWLKAQAPQTIEPEYTIDSVDPTELAEMFYNQMADTEHIESEE